MGFFGPPAVASTGRTLPTIPITSGRVLHLDASAASSLYDATSGGSQVSVGGSVARWEDQSGNGRNATQTTSNNRPVYRKYDDIGGLYFDGFNDTLTGSFTSLGAQTVCVAGLFSLSASESNARLFSQRNAGNNDYDQTGHYIPLLREGTNSTIGSFATSGQRVQTSLKINHLSIMAIHSGSALKIRLNGTDSSTFNHTLNGTFSEYSICSNFGSERLNSIIYEVVVFNSALSSSDMTLMDDYFKDKYRWAW